MSDHYHAYLDLGTHYDYEKKTCTTIGSTIALFELEDEPEYSRDSEFWNILDNCVEDFRENGCDEWGMPQSGYSITLEECHLDQVEVILNTQPDDAKEYLEPDKRDRTWGIIKELRELFKEHADHALSNNRYLNLIVI